MNTNSSVARGSIPAGYGEALRWNISQMGGRVVIVQVFASILFILGLAVFFLLAIGLGRIDSERGLEMVVQISEFPYQAGVEIGRQLAGTPSAAKVRLSLQALGSILLLVGGVLGLQMVVAFLHEGIHGAAMRAFGARPQFGFIPKGILFYATTPGYAYSRGQYLWVGIAPLVCLNSIFFLILLFPIGAVGSAIIAVLAALNTGGAVGDLWTLAVLRKFPPHAYVIDEKDGMRIFLPVEAAVGD